MNAIKKLREAKGWTQKDLANKLGIHFHTVSHWDQQLRSPSATTRKLLMNLFKVSEAELFTDQESFLDRKAIEDLQDSSFKVMPKRMEKSGELPIVSCEDLYSENILNPLIKRGLHMFRVIVGDSDNAPDILKGDELLVNIKINKEDGRYYLARDSRERRVILRQLKTLSGKEYLRTKNLRFEDSFDKKRFDLIGRVVKHSREM